MKRNKNFRQPSRRRSGFTLIEIMVVVVIIGMLAALVGANLMDRAEEAKRTTTLTQIREIENALGMYRLHNGVYPSTQQGLEALVKKPTTNPIPKRYADGGYMKKIPEDAWGYPYIYRCPGEKDEYDVVSTGPDGEEGGEGKNKDVTNHD